MPGRLAPFLHEDCHIHAELSRKKEKITTCLEVIKKAVREAERMIKSRIFTPENRIANKIREISENLQKNQEYLTSASLLIELYLEFESIKQKNHRLEKPFRIDLLLPIINNSGN